MFGLKLLRRVYTNLRKRLFARRRARKRLNKRSEIDYNQLIRLQLREHTHLNGGTFGQPVTNYYCKVWFGTPRKRFNIQFDLSLNDHFIPHKEPMRFSQHFKRGYSGKRSLTSEKLNQKFKLKHLGILLSGKSYVDDVRIELYSASKLRSRSMICKSSRKKMPQDSDRDAITDLDDDDDDLEDSSSDEQIFAQKRSQAKSIMIARDAHNIVALRMRFVAIARDTNNKYFQRNGIDGFFGLGLMHQTSTGCINFIDILKQSGHINQSMFSFSFNERATTSKNKATLAPQLEICFGGFERNYFVEPIYWHKSPSRKHWLIKLTSVYLGDDFVGNFRNPRHLALLTTSENEIFGPIEIVQKIYNLLEAKLDENSGLAYVDCRAMSKLPILRISTKRVSIALEPVNYIRQVDGKCFVAIMPSGERNNYQWRLGTSFFSRSYNIFNLSHRRIGFANLVNSKMVESAR